MIALALVRKLSLAYGINYQSYLHRNTLNKSISFFRFSRIEMKVD